MTGTDSQYHGVLLYDKAPGISSHDAVAHLRRTLHQRKIGHTGTLDPLAEGLLVMCLGRATKIARFLSGFDKTYQAEVCLGQVSSTLDGEGVDKTQVPQPVPDMTEPAWCRLLDTFQGRISQKVPAYSAVKVDGRRLYDLARRGVPVTVPEREIDIREIQLLGYKQPRLSLKITCSSGTYIRSLAAAIGERVGCGAYLSHLRRLAVGDMMIDEALTAEQTVRCHADGTLHQHLLDIETVLEYSTVTVSDEFRNGVLSGKTLTGPDILQVQGDFTVGDRLLLKDTDGRVLAVGTAEATTAAFKNRSQDNLFSYLRVLN
ncbi:MAG: tRNA pseudouridine(55) synthase TruB [bacterium]